ncbi:MAG: hypothetical protein GY705_07475, partial [Bacteroidetes bacterium]|nr:hypothetical protein [Bacteroidota bacterium]
MDEGSGHFVTDLLTEDDVSADFVRESVEEQVQSSKGVPELDISDSNSQPSVVDFVRAKKEGVQSQSGDIRIVQFNDNKSSQSYNVDSFSTNQITQIYSVPTNTSQTQSLSNVYVQAYNANACPINVVRFQSFLSGYPPQKMFEVIDIVKNGAKIHSSLVFDPDRPVPPNQKSTVQYKTQVDDLLMSELKLNRVAGPFLSSPPGLILSPLGAVPKRDSEKIRIIHNLSYPIFDSVNYNIPSKYCSVEYELIDVCTSLVASIGKGCLMGKADLSQAFRLLRVNLFDLHFLGFTWNDLFYFDTMLPMGASVSCSVFEKFSSAIQWILINKFKVPFMSHILDDFLFFGHPNTSECFTGLQSFLSLAESLSLPVKQEKTVFPSTEVEMHGIMFNSQSMMLYLPPDKVKKALH